MLEIYPLLTYTLNRARPQAVPHLVMLPMLMGRQTDQQLSCAMMAAKTVQTVVLRLYLSIQLWYCTF
jgi:hypothetical protein